MCQWNWEGECSLTKRGLAPSLIRQVVVLVKENPAQASSNVSFGGGLCLLGLLNTTKSWFTYSIYSASNLSLLHGLQMKTTSVANSAVLDTASRTHSLQMSLFWQAALDPSAEAPHVTKAPAASMSYTFLRNQEQSVHHWIRDKDGTVGHVPASYFSIFTSTIPLYLQQEFHPARGSRAHPGHWHLSVLPKQAHRNLDWYWPAQLAKREPC